MQRLCSRCQNPSDTGKSWCRKCHAAYCREWTKAHQESRSHSTAKYYAANRSKVHDWQERNKAKLRQAAHKRYLAHRQTIIARSKIRREQWQAADSEGYRACQREYVKAWRSANPERAKANQRANENRRWRIDARYRASRLIANRMNQSLRRNGAGGKRDVRWETLVGYTCDELVSRLNQTLPSGYSWRDYLDGALHVDHIIPIAAFNFRSPNDPDFRRCWALGNLQLLPAKENMRKGAKLAHPHQPGLAFG